MSDQGADAEPGWFPDPQGRHEHRYWDGAAWTDQVSDGGRVGTDPVDAAPTGIEAGSGQPVSYGPDPATDGGGAGRKVPVGILALVAVAVAGVVLAVVFVASGGDDGGGDTADDSGGTADTTDDDGGDGEGTGTFEGTISEDEPVAVQAVTLAAGDALRVVVVPSAGDSAFGATLDPTLSVAVDEDGLTDGFAGLLAPDGDQDQIDDQVLRQTIIVAQEVLDEDTASGLSIVYESGVFPDDFVEDVLGAIGEVSPEVADAGPLFLGTDRAAGEDPEGLQLVAPAAGTYTVVIAGYNHSEGDYEVSLEVEPADDAALDGDEIDYLDYLATYGEHVDFFCDEDFFGGDPEDVTSYGPTICDPDELAGVLSGEFNGDFTNDFGGGGDPYSDYSYDFSGDFSDDGDASAATTVSDDFADPPATSALGQPVPPSQFIDEFGTVPRFDRLARRCFAGNLALCDRLYSVTPVSPSTNSYEGYGATCGGRLAAEAPATCTTYG